MFGFKARRAAQVRAFGNGRKVSGRAARQWARTRAAERDEQSIREQSRARARRAR